MEFGGYLPIELTTQKEYFDSYGDVMRFNSARNAILYYLMAKKAEKVYIPVYLCESVRNSLEKYNISYAYYNIDSDFSPLIEDVKESEAIIVTNYYGIGHNNERLVDKFPNVIFDNTQAFYEKPVKGAANVYSARKFFGVCDGAYLISENIPPALHEPYKPEHSGFLTDCITHSTNYAYNEFLLNEKQIEESSVLGMSSLSRRILQGTDYDNVRKIRQNSFRLLNDKLNSINELKLPSNPDTVPMTYPLLLSRDGFRQALVSEKVYVPQWWKYILSENNANSFERKLSEFLIPLPIDQRYTATDMENLCSKVISILGGLK